MRFMMLVKADKDYETGRPPDARLAAVIGQHGEELFDPADLPEEARHVR